jgi:Peptidase family M28
MKARLKKLTIAVTIATTVLVQGAYALSDDTTRDLDAIGSPLRPAPADPAIAHALQQISPQQIQHTIETLVSFHTRNTLSSMTNDLRAGQGVSAAADWIESEFKRYSEGCGGCLEVRRDTFTESPQSRIPQATTITNVYAILRGSDPEQAKRMYLVTGHYDSRNTDVLDTHGEAPGANDDASGVAISLECARVLSKIKFPATLVFVAVAGEEQGLNGSRHLAKLAKSEGWQLDAVLNNDIVGGDTTPGDTLENKSLVRVFSEGIPASATPEQARLIQSLGYESDSPSRELARLILNVSETYHGLGNVRKSNTPTYFHPVLEFRRDRFLRGGDHTSFNGEGFAAVRFTEWRENFNHQHQNVRTENGIEYGDLLKFVDYQYVAHVAALNAATLATLAYAPPVPENVRIVTKNLDNNTTLNWTAANAPSGTKYEVVWRELAAPTWQFSTDKDIELSSPPNHYSATLPISKDNVIFGVRSVDAQGHRSPAVAPLPEH